MEAGSPSQEQSFLLLGVFSMRVSSLDSCVEFREQVSSQEEEGAVIHDQKLMIKGKFSYEGLEGRVRSLGLGPSFHPHYHGGLEG